MRSGLCVPPLEGPVVWPSSIWAVASKGPIYLGDFKFHVLDAKCGFLVSFHLFLIRFFQPFDMGEVSSEAQFDGPSILVIAFSARSLAEAVRDYGVVPVGVDCFGDQDFVQMCQKCLLLKWPNLNEQPAAAEQIVARVQSATSSSHGEAEIAVLLGGGTENWPSLIESLGSEYQLFGPNTEVLIKLRSAQWLEYIVMGTDVSFPTSVLPSSVSDSSKGEEIGRNEKWLWKPLSGAGGMHIEYHTPGEGVKKPKTAKQSRLTDVGLLQKHVQGRVLGVTFVLPEGKSPEWVGCTEAWQSDEWPAELPFLYRGSWGPIRIHEEHRLQLQQLASNVQQETGLRGWLQMDLIEDSAGRLWLLEFNPRWTSGMEILHKAQLHPVAKHCQCFGECLRVVQHTSGKELDEGFDPSQRFAKAIVYAKQGFQLSNEMRRKLKESPFCSDIPADHIEEIDQGEPVVTVHGVIQGTTDEKTARENLLLQLQLRAEAVESVLY